MSKTNDFFNLNSDSDSESNEQQELNKKIKKWDWDDPENYNDYYHKDTLSNKRASSSLIKNSSNKQLKKFDERNQEKFRIENENNESNDNIRLKLIGHNGAVNRVNWSRRFHNKNLLLSSSMDSKIALWNLNTNKMGVSVLSDVHTKAIRNAIWFNNESEVASVSFDQTCAITDPESGQVTNRLQASSILTAVCDHSTDMNTVLIGAKNLVLSWDTRTNKAANSYKSLMGQVQDIICLNGDEFIVCGDVVSKESAQYSIMVWDFKSTAVLSDQIFHEKFICTCLKKHPHNSTFYAQTHGNYIAEFSTKHPFKMNKQKRFESPKHSSNGYAIGFDINKHGSLLATGSKDGQCLIYNVQTTKLITSLNSFSKSINSMPCMDVKFNEFNSRNERTLLAMSAWNGLIKICEF